MYQQGSFRLQTSGKQLTASGRAKRRPNLFFDRNRRPLGDKIEQFDNVGVGHSHAAVAIGGSDLVLVFGAVNVNESVPRVQVVLVEAIEPEDSRRN